MRYPNREMAKKTLLYINPGPTFLSRSQAYQDQFIELSKSFKGYIFTTSRKTETFPIGDFKYFSMKSRYTKGDRLRFVSFCVWNAIKILIQKEKIDLVTTYDAFYTGLIGLISSRITKAKFAPEVRGVFTSPAEWVDNPGSFEIKLKKSLYPLIMKSVLKRADGIRLLFKGQIEPFEKVIQDKVIKQFPSFVSIENFRNIREEKEILFVGFPFKRKGLDILIKAFKKIAPNFPEWRLKIIGWFPNPKELFEAIGNHPQIMYQKPVPHDEIAEHIGSCAIFVLPSRSEAMGRVLVEAMAAGKPRIGSNVEGIPSVINDGIDGLLFETENADDLAEKMAMLMSNEVLRRELGKAGELRAKKEFTKSIYLQNLTNFYNEVLEK